MCKLFKTKWHVSRSPSKYTRWGKQSAQIIPSSKHKIFRESQRTQSRTRRNHAKMRMHQARELTPMGYLVGDSYYPRPSTFFLLVDLEVNDTCLRLPDKEARLTLSRVTILTSFN